MVMKPMSRRDFLKWLAAGAAAAGLSHFGVLNFGGVVPVSARECEVPGEDPDVCNTVAVNTDWCIPASYGGGDPDVCEPGSELNPDMCPDDSPGGDADICSPAVAELDECWPETNEPDLCITTEPSDPDVCIGDTTGDGDLCVPESDPDVCIGDPSTAGDPDICAPTVFEPDVCTPGEPDLCTGRPFDSDQCGHIPGAQDICGEGPMAPDTCTLQLNGNPDSCEPGAIPPEADVCEPATAEPDTCEPSVGEADRCEPEPTVRDPDICVGDTGGDQDVCLPPSEAESCTPTFGDPDECDPPGDPGDAPNRVSLNALEGGTSSLLTALGGAAAVVALGAALTQSDKT